MNISPDQIVLWESQLGSHGPTLTINATLLFTWMVMAILVLISWGVTRNLTHDLNMSKWQNLLEVLVDGMRVQIREASHQDPKHFLPFIGTLFVFIALSNLLIIFPGYQPPTGSLSTTTAFALCVFIAVPLFGISQQGVKIYFRNYLKPNFIMLPFNIIGELSRTLALAVRLYGNIMSGTMIGAILISLIPFFFPVVMKALGLLTGLIQAYIFSVLAMVYIASAGRSQLQETHDQ